MQQINYFTISELAELAVIEAKKDPQWSEFTAGYKISGPTTDNMLKRLPLPTLAFRLVGEVSFVRRDAVGAVMLDYDGKRYPLLSFQIRNTCKEAYLAAHRFAGLLCYHTNEVIKANRNRFEKGGKKSESYCHL